MSWRLEPGEVRAAALLVLGCEAVALKAALIAGQGPAIGLGRASVAAVVVALSLVLVARVVRAAESPRVAWATVVLLCLGTSLWDGLAGAWPAKRLVALLAGALLLPALGRLRERTAPWLLAATRVGAGAAAAAVVFLLPGSSLAPATLGSPLSAAGAMAILEGLFRAPQGFLYRSPILWLAACGVAAMCTRRARFGWTIAAACAGALLMQASMRGRAASLEVLLPLLGLGLGHVLAWMARLARQRPMTPLAVAATAFVLWNFLRMEQYRRGDIPRDDTVAFADVTENSARLAVRALGAPPAWPATWYLAWRYDLPVASVDGLLGRRLFPGPDAREAAVAAGDDEQQALFLEGWSSPRLRGGRLCRRVIGQARLVLPLERAQPLDLALTLAGQGRSALVVNGARVAEVRLAPESSTHLFRLEAGHWRAPLSFLAFLAPPDGELWVERLVVTRRPEPGWTQ